MPTVLVTGAARGIGFAAVHRLAGAEWDVLAGVRRAEDADPLRAAHPLRVTPVTLDITDPEQIAALERSLPDRLDAVVNIAGVVVAGPLEAVPPAELRRQLDVNVVGQMAVAQATLPRLRASRGRLVFVSSVSGLIATPMFGPYNASKFALEGLADALRMELSPWGIRVVLVEPAQTDTDLWRNAEQDADDLESALSPGHRALYARHIAGFRKTIPGAQRTAVPADEVAVVIERALTDRRPRARYIVGRGPRLLVRISRLAPTSLMDVLLRAANGIPRQA
jgi:NAD(P)-dependent dehydrogenase (short-subunit alcohol dehydrogenase family)